MEDLRLLKTVTGIGFQVDIVLLLILLAIASAKLLLYLIRQKKFLYIVGYVFLLGLAILLGASDLIEIFQPQTLNNPLGTLSDNQPLLGALLIFEIELFVIFLPSIWSCLITGFEPVEIEDLPEDFDPMGLLAWLVNNGLVFLDIDLLVSLIAKIQKKQKEKVEDSIKGWLLYGILFCFFLVLVSICDWLFGTK